MVAFNASVELVLKAPVAAAIGVPLPAPGSGPRNHSAAPMFEAAAVPLVESVAVAFRVTEPAPLVGLGAALRPVMIGPVLSTMRITVLNGPQLPAASCPCR